MRAFRSSTLVTLSAIASLTETISIDNLLVAAEGEDSIAYCDGCWCIPETGSECPVDDMPPIDFSDELIANLRAIPFSTMFNMTCDPFTDDTCSPTPALEQGGACVVKLSYDAESEGEYPEGYSYSLLTESSRDKVEETNMEYVTHEGACGVCSTLQDLAVYLETPDLASVGIQCGIQGIISVENGVQCYMNVGFTEACAYLWTFNSAFTRTACPQCAQHAIGGFPNNEDPPTCDLVDCIQCDEDSSGPVFQEYAGRTRRRSGILSKIVRNCTDIPAITHRDPSKAMDPNQPMPTPAPSDSAFHKTSLPWRNVVLSGSALVLALAAL